MTVEKEREFTQARYRMMTGTWETAEEKATRFKELEYALFLFYKKLGAWKD
jgi:hypothetical protein